MAAQVGSRVVEPFQIFVEEPDRRVARVAQEAPDGSASVIVIDAKVMEEIPLIAGAFRGDALLPRP